MQYIKTKVKLPQSQVTIAEFGYRVKPLVYFLKKTWVYFFITIGTKLYIYVLLLPCIYTKLGHHRSQKETELLTRLPRVIQMTTGLLNALLFIPLKSCTSVCNATNYGPTTSGAGTTYLSRAHEFTCSTFSFLCNVL
jgi:hypothetical protein